MTRRTGLRSILTGAGVVLLAMTLAQASSADWKLYLAGGIGISAMEIDTDGQVPGPPVQIDFGGSDNDSSPLVDGALGLEIPMDELVPREWLLDVRLPDWPVRFEMEAAGLREYEFETFSGSETYFSEVKAKSTFFVNIWQDLPMTAAYKPIQYLFGLGRQPRVRRWLEPASFFVGAGVGFADMEVSGTSNLIQGSDDVLDFAWNAGVGINYALTDTVDLSAGYRYVGLPDVDADLLSDPGGVPFAGNPDLGYESEVHELRVQLRVEIWDFRSPWR